MYSNKSISSVKPGYDYGSQHNTNLGQKRSFNMPYQKKRSIKSMDPEKNRLHRSESKNGSNWQKEIPQKAFLRDNEDKIECHKIYLED